MTAPATSARQHPLWATLTSTAVVIPRDDIDTDQIIPARFLTTTARSGLGVHCFADWRYDAEGAPRPHFPLNSPRARFAQVLVAGHNFGCGSSREHAPWSIVDAGFRAVIAGSLADIFRSNAHRNGLLTIAIGDAIRELHDALARQPETAIHIDLVAQTVSWRPGHSLAFPIDGFSKRTLVEGLDELGVLLADLHLVEAWEARTGRSAP